MTEPNTKPHHKISRRGCLVFFLGVFGLGLLYMFTGPCVLNIVTTEQWITDMIIRTAQVGEKLREYANTHDGRYPPDLSTLVEAKLLNEEQLQQLATIQLHRDGPHVEWYYLPGRTLQSGDGDLLMVSPLLTVEASNFSRSFHWLINEPIYGYKSPTRMVLLCSGAVSPMKEEKFQQYLKDHGIVFPLPVNTK